MTIKEQDSEMLEMFNRKYALTEKINHNSKELGKIEAEEGAKSAKEWGEKGKTVGIWAFVAIGAAFAGFMVYKKIRN